MDEKIDAISVAVPTINHYNISKAIIEKGVNLIVEKPLSDTVISARKIMESAEKKGVTLATGHIERHNPAVVYAKEKLESGSWGQVLRISTKRLSPYPIRISDVGVIHDLAVHDLDIIRFLTDSEPASISAKVHSISEDQKEEHVSIDMSFFNKIDARCEVSWLSPKKIREVSVFCEEFTISLDLIGQKILIVGKETKKIQLDYQEPLKNELLDFLISIKDNRNPLVTGRDGLKAVEMIESVYNSIKTGDPCLV